MTASRLAAVVVVSALVSLAVPATAWAAETQCDGSDELLRPSLDEQCGLEATVLGIDVQLGGSDSDDVEPEQDATTAPSPSPSPSPSPAEPPDDGSGSREGTTAGSGTAGDPQDGSADAKTSDETSATATQTGAAAGGWAQSAPKAPAATEIDGRERLAAGPPAQRPDETRVAGPLGSLPDVNEPSFPAAGTVIGTAVALIALGVFVAATGRSLALRRRRPVPSS